MAEAEPDDRQAARNAWIDQQMHAASRPPAGSCGTPSSPASALVWRGHFAALRSGGWMVAQFHGLQHRLITKAEVCHARHPNQCLLAWAIGSFRVLQITVGAVVAPLLAHFWPIVWRGIGVC
jgi:hypothetical protein